MSICLIPARGGSKRIPRKNIREFCGKPMIAWSIDAAKKSECFDHIVVSTDDKEIAEIAISCGAEVPFLRPEKLADDTTSTQAVISHAITWMEENNWECKSLCCLYATAPFVQAQDLKRSREMMKTSRPGTLVYTATTFPFPIQRAVYIDDEGYSKMFQAENFSARSQDLKEAYHDAGQFYLAEPKTWISTTNLFEGMRPLILPRWRVQDIDTEEDWERAELLHEVLQKQKRI